MTFREFESLTLCFTSILDKTYTCGIILIVSRNLIRQFRRSLPKGKEYSFRLLRELRLIKQFKFEQVFLNVRSILDLAPDARYVTRGSAGCSLVGYLMGIHNMDPIKHKFVLSRFMHEKRPDLPDIDIDFAYNERDSIVEKVFSKYAGRAARISNHVMYREGSAVRKALRMSGYNHFIPKHFDLNEVAGDESDAILSRAKEIEGTFSNYSLHCGGIVIFPDQVPEEYKLNDNQVKLNRDDVDRMRLFKIDLLCNRGIAQLNDLSSRALEDYPEEDEATAKMFCSGRAWGVTFGESPAQRRLHVDIVPRNRDDITFSLGLIRPLPSADGRRLRVLEQFHKERNHRGQLIYDDDGILFIKNILGCSESDAEIYRKGFGKKKQAIIDDFTARIKNHPKKNEILRELGYFALYSFCHAHATSYGYLVWALGYEKVRQPKRFWWSALNHAQSMYRPWVHIQEAKVAGLRFAAFGRGPWKMEGDTLTPTYVDSVQGDGWYQFEKRGYWISHRFMPGMYEQRDGNKIRFKGLIGVGRHHTVNGREITFITIGTGMGKYLDLIVDGLLPISKHDVIEGEGEYKNNSVSVKRYEFSNIVRESKQQELFNI